MIPSLALKKHGNREISPRGQIHAMLCVSQGGSLDRVLGISNPVELAGNVLNQAETVRGHVNLYTLTGEGGFDCRLYFSSSWAQTRGMNAPTPRIAPAAPN
jgi:hypothetical protein